MGMIGMGMIGLKKVKQAMNSDPDREPMMMTRGR